MRDTDLLLALVAAAPDAGTLLTQAHPAFGAVFADLYAPQPDPMRALDLDTRALVATGDIQVYTIDGNPDVRAILVTIPGYDRAARVSAAIASADPMPLGGA